MGVARRRGVGVAAAAAAADVVEGPGTHEEEDEEDRGDDYGTTSLLADGMLGGFGEDEERKQKLAYAFSSHILYLTLYAQELIGSKKRLLVDHFDEDQLSRYEAYRRSNLNKGAVKKVRKSFHPSLPPSLLLYLPPFTAFLTFKLLTLFFP